MQIESAEIDPRDKIRLLDALSETGLQNIVVGSFVSPRYTPQMAKVDEIMRGFTPKAGVNYLYLALNDRGHERAMEHVPPLAPRAKRWSLGFTMSDTFLRRNNNRTQQQERDRWPSTVEQAVAAGATSAGISVAAAWGSNFDGKFSDDQRMAVLQEQADLWNEAGIEVSSIGLADPMSWCMPNEVEEMIAKVMTSWPQIHDWTLHLHNARGMAMPSTYATLRSLRPEDTVQFETTCGGIGGCPYCGNGQATGMVPTEDLVNMLEEMGIDTGVDLEKLIECVWLLEEVLGRSTMGHVSKAGPRPRGAKVYDPNLPFIETFDQAKHFLVGADAYVGAISPWKEPIPAPNLLEDATI
jgi:hydroxymethylglutaryl-CoA lyase